jgi:surface protein
MKQQNPGGIAVQRCECNGIQCQDRTPCITCTYVPGTWAASERADNNDAGVRTQSGLRQLASKGMSAQQVPTSIRKKCKPQATPCPSVPPCTTYRCNVGQRTGRRTCCSSTASGACGSRTLSSTCIAVNSSIGPITPGDPSQYIQTDVRRTVEMSLQPPQVDGIPELPAGLAVFAVAVVLTATAGFLNLKSKSTGIKTVLAALVLLLLSPGALAVDPITSTNIRTAAAAWVNDPATAMATYGSIGDWNVAAVSDMNALFYQMPSFNADISKWNTASVSNMHYMFKDSYAFNRPIASWNTAAVTNINSMFRSSAVFVSQFNQNIGAWNVASVRSIEWLFAGTKFNQNIASWNVASVRYMSGFLYQSAFNQNIGAWNVSSSATMLQAFGIASAFNQNIASWSVASVTIMSHTFQDSAFNQNLASWNVASVTTMDSMFKNASAFNQYIGSWNTVRVACMFRMFTNASAFNQVVSTWNVASVRNLTATFATPALSSCNKGAIYVAWGSTLQTEFPEFNVGTCAPTPRSAAAATRFHHACAHEHSIRSAGTASLTGRPGHMQRWVRACLRCSCSPTPAPTNYPTGIRRCPSHLPPFAVAL